MDFSVWLIYFCSVWVLIRFLLLLLQRKNAHERKLPPGPLPLPIVGSLFKLGRMPNESLAQFAESYADLMTVKLGCVTAVVVSSANMAKEVFQKNDQALAGRDVVDAVRALQYSDLSMVWLPPQQRWRKLRTIFNSHMLTTQRLNANQGLRRQKVQKLIAYVGEHCLAGRVLDIGLAAFVTSLNLVSTTVLSIDVVDLSSESSQEFKELVSAIMEDAGRPNLSDYFPVIRSIDPQGVRRRMTSHFGKLHDVFDKLIEERLSSSVRKNDFLDVLLDYSLENGFELGRDDIKAMLVDIFVAASDTSSSTLEWAMAELLRSPISMAKATSELGETIGRGRQVEESDVAQLPYLQAIVKETLQLHPPFPLLLPHKAESDVEICGYTIPKKTKVIVNAWAISRDANVWVDPISFSPERFLDSHVDFKGRDFEFIPFGAGRRICPGMPLASRMVHLMLASLLHSFYWRLPDGMGPLELDMGDKFGITLKKAVPLRLLPTHG